MSIPEDTPDGGSPWPPGPERGQDVVLHTRVITDTGGGPDKTILLSAPFLAHTNYWLAAAYMHPPDDPGFNTVRQRAQDMGSPLISVPDRGPLDRSVLRSMLELCKYYDVRIWHGHDYKSNLLGVLLRPFWNLKLVTTVHGWVKHTSRTPLYYAVDRWSLPLFHHVICVSHDLVQRVGQLGVPEARLSLIENAIDEQAFTRQDRPGNAALRRDLGVPPKRLVVGAVGRLSPEKAFNHLIHAAHELIGGGLDLELWIAGDGDARADLEQLIEHLGLQDRVRLLGFRRDMVELYEAMDVFVLSSLREGLPNVLLEAMAMRVPVVATRVGGVERLVRDGQTGLLCAAGNTRVLAATMKRLLTDPGLQSSLASGGRALVEREYSFTGRMEKVKAIYDRVLGSTARPSRDPAWSGGPDVKTA